MIGRVLLKVLERAHVVVMTGSILMLLAAGGAARADSYEVLVPERVRVMPLGDSITSGEWGGYRADLQRELKGAVPWRVDFVGSLEDGPEVPGGGSHEGHPGATIDDLALGIEDWLGRHNPDIILLHIGTNDIWRGASAEVSTARLDRLLEEIYIVRPEAHVVLASIAPMYVGQDAAWTSFNAAMPGLARKHEAQGRSISLVDMAQALERPDLHEDGVHPLPSGFRKMAEGFRDQIRVLGRGLEP